MRVAIVSDIHGNIEALSSLPSEYDELWVLGDLVDYGPSPREVIDFVRSHATVVVRGNHDHAVAFNSDPHCSPDFREMANATLAYTRDLLTPDEVNYLSNLPLTAERTVDGTRFLLCHATPSDPLYRYLPPDSEAWEGEVSQISADVVLAGHVHKPFVRCMGSAILVNPGSLGQPKRGRSQACYATWDRGIELHAFEYQVVRTVAKIERLPLPRDVRADLIRVLQFGGIVLA